MLEVNEIFGPTIQGEGKKIGTPSVFVRFGKCNMRCEGFEVEYETPSGVKKCSCDSFHASDIAFREEWKKYETAQKLIDEVDKFIPGYKADIVLTGGEPLLYWEDEEFQKFMKHYIDNGFEITIETNASLDIEITQAWQEKILFSMSVKLSNSGEPLSKRVNIKTLSNIINKNSSSYLKFVIDKEFLPKASQEIESIISSIPKCDIYVMPLGDTAKIIDQNSLSVIEYAIEKGYMYSDRLHIRVWDNKRGV
jgi:organic radical activating enzyme